MIRRIRTARTSRRAADVRAAEIANDMMRAVVPGHPPLVRGWRIVHYDYRREVATLERSRWLFKGAYRVATRRALVEGIAP